MAYHRLQASSISPDSVVTGVLTVGVEHRCLLFPIHSRLSKSSKRVSTAQARKIGRAAAGARRGCALVVAQRAFSDTVTFRGRRKGKLASWRRKVTRARGRSGCTLNCRFRGRRSTLRSSRRSDFVTGLSHSLHCTQYQRRSQHQHPAPEPAAGQLIVFEVRTP